MRILKKTNNLKLENFFCIHRRKKKTKILKLRIEVVHRTRRSPDWLAPQHRAQLQSAIAKLICILNYPIHK